MANSSTVTTPLHVSGDTDENAIRIDTCVTDAPCIPSRLVVNEISVLVNTT